ncbi:MAG: DUF1049 domain-containing protein [Solirubrobacteraceae bacterium]|mgnify:CR=1 FL=1|nr:DUF1049 domain-containing protein [Solirubrobacteraceae bacterium]
MSNDPTVQTADPVDRRERNRRIAAIAVGAVIIVFALVNLDEVRVTWIVAETRTPLIVVIAVSFLLGLLGGYLLRGRRTREARRR